MINHLNIIIKNKIKTIHKIKSKIYIILNKVKRKVDQDQDQKTKKLNKVNQKLKIKNLVFMKANLILIKIQMLIIKLREK